MCWYSCWQHAARQRKGSNPTDSDECLHEPPFSVTLKNLISPVTVAVPSPTAPLETLCHAVFKSSPIRVMEAGVPTGRSGFVREFSLLLRPSPAPVPLLFPCQCQYLVGTRRGPKSIECRSFLLWPTPLRRRRAESTPSLHINMSTQLKTNSVGGSGTRRFWTTLECASI